jgi:flagellar motor switch protein FliN/FliY
MSFDGNSDSVASAAPIEKLNAALIDSVGVAVEAFLGETAMTIADLNALTIGQSIALDAPLNQIVELRVNGIAIAQGELVAIGDQFGVRITAVAP